MPRQDALPVGEAEEIEREIKKQLAGAGSNINDAVRQLNAAYGTNDVPQTVGRQLKQGIIPHWKVLRIAKVLGYKIEWIKK